MKITDAFISVFYSSVLTKLKFTYVLPE